MVTLVSSSVVAQDANDTLNPTFQDDLLDHLVGNWKVTSVAHGFSSTAIINAEWVYNHQHLRLHFRGNDTIPWIGMPMEFDNFIGFNKNESRYVIHGISVFGVNDDEGFWYGYRNGNELKIVAKPSITSTSHAMVVQRLKWDPESNTWLIESRQSANGKEGDVFLEMKLAALDTD